MAVDSKEISSWKESFKNNVKSITNEISAISSTVNSECNVLKDMKYKGDLTYQLNSLKNLLNSLKNSITRATSNADSIIDKYITEQQKVEKALEEKRIKNLDNFDEVAGKLDNIG